MALWIAPMILIWTCIIRSLEINGRVIVGVAKWVQGNCLKNSYSDKSVYIYTKALLLDVENLYSDQNHIHHWHQSSLLNLSSNHDYSILVLYIKLIKNFQIFKLRYFKYLAFKPMASKHKDSPENL